MQGIDRLRCKISKACRLLYMKGYVAGVQGNVSARASKDCILITRTGYSMRDISEDDVVSVRMKEISPEHPRPSIELPFHQAIYETRQDVNAIVHTHPYEVLVWLKINRAELLDEVFDEFKNRKTQVIQKLPGGSGQLAESIRTASIDNDIIVLDEHGLVTIGTELVEAVNLTEQVVSKAHYKYMLGLPGLLHTV